MKLARLLPVIKRLFSEGLWAGARLVVPLLGQRLRAGADAGDIRVLTLDSESRRRATLLGVVAARLLILLFLLLGFFSFTFLESWSRFFRHPLLPFLGLLVWKRPGLSSN